MLPASDAEDVVQETFVEAYRALPRFEGRGSLRGWLFTIARRKCSRLRRSRARAHLTLVEPTVADPDDGSPEVALEARQRADRAARALATLSEDGKEGVLMRFGAGLSYREIGEIWGVEEATARKRVSRAIAKLRRTVRPSSESGGSDE